jgi:hypothetical protein
MGGTVTGPLAGDGDAALDALTQGMHRLNTILREDVPGSVATASRAPIRSTSNARAPPRRPGCPEP